MVRTVDKLPRRRVRAGTSARQRGRIRITQTTVPGPHGPVRVRWYEPTNEQDPAAPTMVWVHGGGFAAGGLWHPESWATGRHLASNGVRVLSVGYRLVKGAKFLSEPTPERLATGVRYPIPLDDVVAAITSLGSDRYLLGGASAGACLAAAATLRMLRAGGPEPSALLLVYGTFHAELPAPSAELASVLGRGVGRVHFRDDRIFNMNLGYAGSRERMADPLVFPGGHELTGFPPTFLFDAERDSLRASSEAFAAELRAAGATVTHRVLPRALHGFLTRTWMPAYRHGIRVVVDWACQHAASAPADGPCRAAKPNR